MMFWTQMKTVAVISGVALAITAAAAIAIERDGASRTVSPPIGQVTSAAPTESLSARQTLVKIAAAIKTGDAAYVASHIASSTPGQKMVVDNQARTCTSVVKFTHAYADAFGQAAADQLPAMVGPTEIPPNTEVVETGETASVDFGVGEKVKMLRQDGVWKWDYSSMSVNTLPLSDEQLAAYLNRTLVVMDQVTLGLELGKYKTPNDCLAALRTLTIQAAHEPTTKP